MPAKRKGGPRSSSSKKKKMTKEAEEEEALTFSRYADPDEGCITMDGLVKLSEDLGIDPATDTKLLVLCWRLGASKPGAILEDEWAMLETSEDLPTSRQTTPTVEALKRGWASLDPSFLDNDDFRPFFKFCFEFNREGTKKFLERDTAVSLLPLCIENRSPHTSSFLDFLKTQPEDFKLNKDQWCSFLDFSFAIGPPPDFVGWDAEQSSWPILLDEYVEWAKAAATTTTTTSADGDS